MLPLLILFLLIGLLMIGLAIPLILGKVPPNSWYGFRIRLTLDDPEIWYPANRYGGFKALRQRWHEHIQGTLLRPILLIDEAQEMPVQCLTELRLLGSVHFDSECLLTSVLCGDSRLPERFRDAKLVSLGSRIRTRWMLQPWDRASLAAFLEHALRQAAGQHLMTPALKDTLVQHCAGNLRMLCGMAEELLEAAVQREAKCLDEKLYMEVFSRVPLAATGQRKARAGAK